MQVSEREGSSRAEREAQFHDRRFSERHGTRPASRFYRLTAPSRRELLARVGDLPTGSRVLELGCGPDSQAWELAARGLSVTAIDISTAAVDLARAEATTRDLPVQFEVMNAESIGFADGSFDAVIGSSILHHLDLTRAVPEVRRVLSGGGHALFYEPSGHNPAINLYRRLTPSQRSDDERPLTTEDRVLLESGFDQLEVRYFHLSSLAALGLLRTPWFDRAAAALERFDGRLFKRVPPLRKYAWVMVIHGTVQR